MGERQVKIAIALTLILLAVGLRVAPHPANFAPMTAVALFAGAVLPRRFALSVPLMAIVLSDLVIGFYSMAPVVWTCYVLIALASSAWLRRPNLVKGVALTLSSSLFFFVVTNFAVWLTSGMYARTLAGLRDCFVLALPFFRATATSDLFYTALFFSFFATAVYLQRHVSLKQPTPR